MAVEPHGDPAAAGHATDAAHGAAAGGHEAAGAFPPFDATTFASQLVWFAITFGLLYFFVSRFVLPKVGAVLERRTATRKADLDIAQRESEAAERVRQEAERTSASARADARKLIEGIRAEAAAELAAEQAKAEEAHAAKVAAAEAAIADKRAKALAQIDGIAKELAGDIVNQLAGAKAQRVRA